MKLLTKKQEKAIEEKERALDEQRLFVDMINADSNEVQKSNLEIARQNNELTERLTRLIAENKEKEKILLERELEIKRSEKDIEDRITNVRKEEVLIEARKSDVRRKEQDVSKQEKYVVEREEEAQKVKSESEQAKEKYQTLFDELEGQKENINYLEKEADRKNKLATEKETAANNIFEKAKVIDAEIKAKEAEFEAKIEEIESALNAKIEEYDRKLEDMNNVQEFIDNINFDDSEDGRAAKIVVKEAIRQAKKSLNDIKTQFDELDEKYCGGTFKGFSTPITEIDKSFDELKAQYQQVKAHIETSDNLPESINTWLECIEDYINNADNSKKSWEFSEAYRNIIYGLSTCKNYEMLVNILYDWGNSGTNNEGSNEQEKTFTDWYDVLGVDPSATTDVIKKKFRELAKLYHSDKVKPRDDREREEFEEKIRLIIQAWTVLKDEEKRKQFDEERKNHNG